MREEGYLWELTVYFVSSVDSNIIVRYKSVEVYKMGQKLKLEKKLPNKRGKYSNKLYQWCFLHIDYTPPILVVIPIYM